jgi:hypothetical protein
MYVAHIASRVLEAAGAYYTSATPQVLRGSWGENRGDVAKLAILVTYTRGGAAGYPKLRIVWTHALASTPATTITARDTTNNAITTSSGAAQIDNLRTEILMKGFSDLAAIDYDVVKIDVPPGATHIKVECAEVGNTGAPGTIVVDIDGEV